MVFVFLESVRVVWARAGSLERAISVMAAVHTAGLTLSQSAYELQILLEKKETV